MLPPGGGGLLQHLEGVRLPLCEEGADLCEGKRGVAHLFSKGKRQTGLIYQRLLCHSATPGGGQLRTTLTYSTYLAAIHRVVNAERCQRTWPVLNFCLQFKFKYSLTRIHTHQSLLNTYMIPVSGKIYVPVEIVFEFMSCSS